MDWGRAKTILIVAFLCLNLLLGYQLWFHKMDIPGLIGLSPDASSETKNVLQSRGIGLEVEIPQEIPKVKEITVRVEEDDSSDDIHMLPERVSNRAIHIKSEWRETLAKQVAHADQYVLDPMLSTAEQYVFNQVYQGIPMFEVNLIFYHDETAVYGYKQRYVEVSSNTNNPDPNMLSAYRAVEFLANNILSAGSVITDIRLGYHGQKYDSDMQYFAPKWRITLQDGTVYYIHAINGEVESAQKEL